MADFRDIADSGNGDEITAEDRYLEEMLAQLPRRKCPARVRANVMARLRAENATEPAPAESRQARVVTVWFRRRLRRMLEAAAVLAVAVVSITVYLEVRSRPELDGVKRAQPETGGRFVSPRPPADAGARARKEDARRPEVENRKPPASETGGLLAKFRPGLEEGRETEPGRATHQAERQPALQADRMEEGRERDRLRSLQRTPTAARRPEVPAVAGSTPTPPPAVALKGVPTGKKRGEMIDSLAELEVPAEPLQQELSQSSARERAGTQAMEEEAIQPRALAGDVSKPQALRRLRGRATLDDKEATALPGASAAAPRGGESVADPPPAAQPTDVTDKGRAIEDKPADRDGERGFAFDRTPETPLESPRSDRAARRVDERADSGRASGRYAEVTNGRAADEYAVTLNGSLIPTSTPLDAQVSGYGMIRALDEEVRSLEMAQEGDGATTWGRVRQPALAAFRDWVNRFGGSIESVEDVALQPGNRPAILVACLVPHEADAARLIETLERSQAPSKAMAEAFYGRSLGGFAAFPSSATGVVQLRRYDSGQEDDSDAILSSGQKRASTPDEPEFVAWHVPLETRLGTEVAKRLAGDSRWRWTAGDTATSPAAVHHFALEPTSPPAGTEARELLDVQKPRERARERERAGGTGFRVSGFRKTSDTEGSPDVQGFTDDGTSAILSTPRAEGRGAAGAPTQPGTRILLFLIEPTR